MPENYADSRSLREKILYLLSIMEKASANEVAAEVMELDGIATEESVGDITREIEEELNKLFEEEVVLKLKEHRQKVRYVLNKLAGFKSCAFVLP